MRITKYTALLDTDRKPMLVKEDSKNCPEISRLDNPQKIFEMINLVYHTQALPEEYVWVLALDQKNHPVGIFEVSHGTVNASVVTPREVFMRLLLCGATYFVLIHNHPSGDLEPSADDMNVTKRMKECGTMMGIGLLDHIIIGDGYLSFKETGML